MTLKVSGQSHPGRVRSANEDCWMADPSLGLVVVADGMGGHSAGEVASQLAVESIRNFLQLTAVGEAVTWPYGLDPTISFDANRLATAIKLANRRVFKESESHDEYTGMGTTVVAVLVVGDRVIYASVGDSRLYSFQPRAGLSQLTRDDSWVAQLLSSEPSIVKADLAHHPMRHVLTSVIGARESLSVTINERRPQPDELLLLCSDGLHGALDDVAIASILGAEEPFERYAERLIEAALEGPASDNVTAVILNCA